jgi:hypothetical protein
METEDQRNRRKVSFVRAHFTRENALETLRFNHAILWERSKQCLDAEEERLLAIGAGVGAPIDQLANSLGRLESSLTKDLPNVPTATITDIALGTVSDWLIRCPLDFPEPGP